MPQAMLKALIKAGVACGGAVIPLCTLLFWRKATGLAASIGMARSFQSSPFT